jgi:protein dithiol oxidoreductase (disulfide-forming)
MRYFMIHKLTALITFLLLTGLAVLPVAAADEPAAGIDYQVIDPPVPTKADEGRVEVVELFWYGCPHCYNFEPHVHEWKARNQENVTFRYLPAVFNDLWAFHARVFYAAESLDLLDKLHAPFFHAIHAQGRRMADERSVLRFVEQQGVDPREFQRALASDEVTEKVREAIQLTREYRIEGVPAVAVDGRHLVSPGMSGSFDTMMRVMDHLVDKASGEPGASR